MTTRWVSMAVTFMCVVNAACATGEELREIQYRSSADGTIQPAMYYAPGGNRPAPLLVALHTWSGDYRQDTHAQCAKWCQDQGWVYIHPDFRGPNRRPKATGSDLAVQDVVDAVSFASQHANVDPTRVYLVGTSGGGYMALLMAGRHPELWAGVSAWVPIVDLERWYHQNKADGDKHWREIAASCGGPPGASEQVDAEYRKRSPITWLEGARRTNVDVNAGIRDGHDGSVPVSHALRAFNEIARTQDRLSEAEIDYFVREARVPPHLRQTVADDSYGEKQPLFRRQADRVRVTLFDGGHELIPMAALRWLEQQRRIGAPPDGAGNKLRTGKLVVDVTDPNGQPLPCRALVRAADGKCRTPPEAIVLDIGPDRWFVCDGSFRMAVPKGEFELRVEHGLEFKRFRQRLRMPAEDKAISVSLDRWIDMKRRGFLCAENHLHVDANAVGPMAIAEGLDFASSLTWWNGDDADRPVPVGDGPTRQLRFSGHEIVASIHDAELEYGWGAAYIQNLPHSLPLPPSKRRPNYDYLKYATSKGALIHYQGGWSREVGLDALLGVVHTVNVCNNNFHLHRFQPRSKYSNLLEVPGFPTYPDTDVGMMQMNTDTYYRLLNWGLRLAAGAGSATGVKQVPVGYNRTYVQIDPSATIDQFNDAWKAGRNFVTNGPVVLLTGPQGETPGDDMILTAAGELGKFRLDVVSDQPLTSVEIVQDGDVVQQLEITDDHQAKYTFDVTANRSGWIAARCTARDRLLSDEELQTYDNPPYQRPSRLRFAHTSPIYLSVDGQPSGVRKSIEEGLLMLDQLEVYGQSQAAVKWRDEFVRNVARGRAELQRRLIELPE